MVQQATLLERVRADIDRLGMAAEIRDERLEGTVADYIAQVDVDDLSAAATAALHELDDAETNTPATYDELLALYFSIPDGRFDDLRWETSGDASAGEDVEIEATLCGTTFDTTIEVDGANRIDCAQLIPFLNDIAAWTAAGDTEPAPGPGDAMGFNYAVLPMRRLVFYVPPDEAADYIGYFGDVRETFDVD